MNKVGLKAYSMRAQREKQEMKLRSLLFGITLATASASSFAVGPPSEYVFTYVSKLELVNGSGAGGSAVIMIQTIGAGGDVPGMAAHWEKEGKPETIVKGNTTIFHSVTKTYGYELVVTPKTPAPGEFEKSGHVQTAIAYEQILKGANGEPVKYRAEKDVSLAIGRPTTLEWTNDGKAYRLTVELARSEHLQLH